MDIDPDIINFLIIYIKKQNMELLKLISDEEGWDLKLLIEEYIKE